ncbi:GGDEF domain-containing protein [Aestuariirhabdus haliotis]|uniref:GGDEF domain-containing protein n=1 Tax=Aestuariirhabdus haliotis TaxID=2918751 RepID=UPI0020C08668|nr:sensor domain-containing diguanylate cyclase [Aestuariirhabdus haliotis]
MKEPAIPSNEEHRVAKLHELGVLDTPPEQRFDRLTRMAERIFNVPIALVSLIDSDRQWFKSAVGIDIKESPRQLSFCGHAILGEGLFLVPDARLDSRFADNPMVLGEPHVRFYAGCPLKALDGSRLGTLCVIDRKPRHLSEQEQETLRDLAAMVERELVAVELATIDELTGISNRRGFMLLAQHSLNLCLRQQVPVTMVYLDLNQFKPINDQYGHAEGDRVLHDFADLLRRSFRVTDLFARLGGDEFVVLLINASQALAESIIVKLQRVLDEWNDTQEKGYRVSFSHGITEYDLVRHADIGALMESADTQMYRNKSMVER